MIPAEGAGDSRQGDLSAVASPAGPLRFYDHHRQRYAEKVSVPDAGEFQIGDYIEGDGTVGDDGEFKITLVELHGDRRWSLYPHLGSTARESGRCVGESNAGLLDVLGPVNSRDEFARRLLAIGRHLAFGGRIVRLTASRILYPRDAKGGLPVVLERGGQLYPGCGRE
jgi:hypothetical protein